MLSDVTVETLDLDLVKQYLRVEHNLDDLEIKLYIDCAIRYVRTYTKCAEDQVLDKELLIPVLNLIGHFYANKNITLESTESLSEFFGSFMDMYREDIL